jgi:hypothetical protein
MSTLAAIFIMGRVMLLLTEHENIMLQIYGLDMEQNMLNYYDY